MGYLQLNEIWRICRKIQAVIFRFGIGFLKYFENDDPNEKLLISESKFVNMLENISDLIGLCHYEIQTLADYFRVADGRIAYGQLCHLLKDDLANDRDQNLDIVSGLEWDDPLLSNIVSPIEERRLCVLLSKVAQTIRLREIVLQPYFQDYDTGFNSNGTISIPHFSRILKFLRIHVTNDDFVLLRKKYMKYSHLINYLGFIKDIEAIIRYLDSNRLVDFSKDIVKNFPGRFLDANLPKLPRPEIINAKGRSIFKNFQTHPTFFKNNIDTLDNIENITARIKKHVYDNQIRIHDFYDGYDPLHTGFVTKNQFIRILDNIGLSGLHRLYLNADAHDVICYKYQSNADERINWRDFEADIDSVFTHKELEKKPYQIVHSPSNTIANIQRHGQENWYHQNDQIKDVFEDALHKIKSRVKKRRLYLDQFFRAMDKNNNGHVSSKQMQQVIFSNCVILSEEETNALEKRYNNNTGFNYAKFLSEVNGNITNTPKYNDYENLLKLVNSTKEFPSSLVKPDITYVIAKVKRQAVAKRIRIIDFIKDYDKNNKQTVSANEFERGLCNANINLLTTEIQLLTELFADPQRQGYVDFKRFCDVIDEAFYQKHLERSPLLVPLQHFPSRDNAVDNFLNFEERLILSKALQNLSKQPDEISNVSTIFKNFDNTNCGSISRNQFLRALALRGLHYLISNRELDIIFKYFSIKRGTQHEVDYGHYLKTLKKFP